MSRLNAEPAILLKTASRTRIINFIPKSRICRIYYHKNNIEREHKNSSNFFYLCVCVCVCTVFLVEYMHLQYQQAFYIIYILY